MEHFKARILFSVRKLWELASAVATLDLSGDSRRSLRLFAVLITATALFSGCRDDLPSGFEKLPLDQKVKEYELHLVKHGLPLSYARAAIARHGVGAADLACDLLAKDSRSLPAYEALQIVHLVQTGGCSLKQTRCGSAIKSFMENHSTDTAEGQYARITLEAIEHDYVSPTWHISACDHRGG